MNYEQQKHARDLYVDGVALTVIATELGVPLDEVREAVLPGTSPAPAVKPNVARGEPSPVARRPLITRDFTAYGETLVVHQKSDGKVGI